MELLLLQVSVHSRCTTAPSCLAIGAQPSNLVCAGPPQTNTGWRAPRRLHKAPTRAVPCWCM